MQKSLFGILIALALAVAPLAGHEGHTHRYMGTIATVSGDQLELKTTAGKMMTFKVNDTTRITRGPEKGSKDDLKVGSRAVVEADDGTQPATAKRVKLPSKG